MSICSILTDDGNLCGESPLWDATAQKLYWTDAAGGKFYSYDWNARRRDLILEGFEVTGCALDHSGGLTFINNSGVWSWNRKDKPKLIVAESGDEKLQLNDCIADPEGRLLAGSCFYNPASEYPLGKLFCLHLDGTVQILDEGFHLANGLGFSPDRKSLYFADSIARVIYKYDYDPTAGHVHNRRIFCRVDSDSGLPDGLTVDAPDLSGRRNGTEAVFLVMIPMGDLSGKFLCQRNKHPPWRLVAPKWKISLLHRLRVRSPRR